MPEVKRKKDKVVHVRLDDRMRFALELLGKQESKKHTAIIEDGINSRANAVITEQLGVQWTALYDSDEGVRTLNLLSCPGYRADAEEQEVRGFTVAHKEFFYADTAATVPHRDNVIALWPKLAHYREMWRERRHGNYLVAAEAMAAQLKKVHLPVPKFGQKKK